MISIQILSWNRPVRLFLTLISLKRSLWFSDLKYELFILDQNSNRLTKLIINLFKFDKKIFLNENIGMAKAWEVLFNSTSNDVKYVLQLENDWWCLSIGDGYLKTAIESLEKENCAFIKLRKNYDLQAGTNLINKEPQTIFPVPFNIFEIKYLKDEFCLYSGSKFSCFTFNPTLMKYDFRNKIKNLYRDNINSKIDILRSGEDLPTSYWENQTEYVSGIISNPAFVHTGFHSRRYVFIKVPIFLITELFCWFYLIFSRIFKFNV